MSAEPVAFDPEKITLIEFRMVKGHLDTPETFDPGKINGYRLDHSMKFSFNLDQQWVKADFFIQVMTEGQPEQAGEAQASFHLLFIYAVANLRDYTQTDTTGNLTWNATLANALASLTYSTSRGILMMRLSGTALQAFILPIVDPNKLIR
jgi:hypothetical protein